MSADIDREWYYCNQDDPVKKGPVPSIVLCKLLEKGISVHPITTLVWKQGMETWLPMSNVSIHII